MQVHLQSMTQLCAAIRTPSAFPLRKTEQENTSYFSSIPISARNEVIHFLQHTQRYVTAPYLAAYNYRTPG